MPIYTYNCPECSITLDRMAPMAERDNQTCKNCDGDLTRKIDKPGAVWNPSRSSGAMRT